MEKNVRLLNGTYTTKEGKNNGVKLELFGKTEDGKSITIVEKNFDPYFKIVEPPKSLINNISRDGEVKNISDETLWVTGKIRECKRVTIKHPWKVPEYKKRLSDRCQILDADIPFVLRFIYDNNIDSCFKVKGKEIKNHDYTTDLAIEAKEFGECENFFPTLKVMSFDMEKSIENDEIYVISAHVREEETLKVKSFKGKDKGLIEDFVEFINDEDPDVITGYNINGYDLPELEERAEQLNVSLNICRNHDTMRQRNKRDYQIKGRMIADAWWAVKSEMDLKRETLNHVAKELFGKEKLDVDPSNIDQEWKENRERVIEYCEKDAELAGDVLEELGVLQKAMDLGTVSMLPVDECLNPRTSVLIDSLFIREAIDKDIGVLQNNYQGGEDSDQVKGGFVYQPDPGIHKMIPILDFKSMYPSEIMKNNICLTTLASIDDTLPYEGKIESPVGAKFYSKDQREGILPDLLEELMEKRDETKAKRDNADDPKEADYYDRLQAAIKVVMNSFYGVFASSFYRFTNKDIGESITAFARESIKEVIKELEDEGYEVVYSDTDSVFFKSPHENDLEKTIELGKEVAEKISGEYMILELEKIADPFYSHGKKKRYIGRIVWPEEDRMVKGYETRRSDSFEAQNEAMKQVFQEVLNENQQGAVDAAREYIENVKNGNIDLKKLIISISCKKFSEYKKPEQMAQVQAAKKMMKKGYEFTPGQRVSWIVTNSTKTPQEVEPWIEYEEFEHEPDWEYYANRIAKTLARLTKTFGWDQDALMMGTDQQTLF